jgi:hypothetical protein
MKPYILLVTWLIPGQPSNSYQVTFFSEEACVAARDAVLADGRRVKADHDQVQIDAAKASEVDPALFLASKESPAVTAVCAAQIRTKGLLTSQPSLAEKVSHRKDTNFWNALFRSRRRLSARATPKTISEPIR